MGAVLGLGSLLTIKSIMNKLHLAIGALIVVMAILLVPRFMDNGLGGAQPGTAANLKVATTTAPGPQASVRVTLFAPNSACKSRVVSTTGNSAIMINLGEPATVGNLSSTSVSGTQGFWQAASTTVAYDAELYGCGRWTAFAYATTVVAVAEYQ